MTAAVKDRDFVRRAAEKFGVQCIVVAIDAKRVSGPGEPPRWEIFTHGGRNPTGIDAIAYARGGSPISAPASCSSPRWIAMAPSPAMISN